MDVLTFVKEKHEALVRNLKGFATDLGRLWRASKPITAAIAAGGLLRGIGVAIVFQHLGNVIDTAIGARGIGVVTSEFRSDVWIFLAVLLVVYLTTVCLKRMSGLSASIADRITNVALPVSLVIITFPLLEASISLVICLWAVRGLIHNRPVVALLSAMMAGLSFFMLNDVLVFTASRTITVGTMVMIGGAELFFGLWIAARPYFASLK